MKTTATVLAALIAIGSTAAAQRQQPDQAELERRLEAKKGEAFLGNASWIFDFEKAKEIARKEDKRLFSYFTRSYSP